MGFKFGDVQIFSPDLRVDFMRWKHIWIGISVALVVVSFLSIAIRGINYSIDYLGGSEITVSIKHDDAKRDELSKMFNGWNVGEVEVTTLGAVKATTDEKTFLVRMQREKHETIDATTARAEKLVTDLKKHYGNDKVTVSSVSNISGKVGGEEQMRGYMAVLFSLIGILIYVSIRFDSRFAPGAVLCLLHDVIIALGFMTLIGKPFTVASVAAFLTIVGYSTNDTIIVYDRIREVTAINPRMALTDVVNLSINQTMNRTVLTGVTALMCLMILMIFGGGSLRDFALTMFVGILVGSYSSIYVAAPLTLVMDEFLVRKGWRKPASEVVAVKKKDPDYIPPVVLKKKNP